MGFELLPFVFNKTRVSPRTQSTRSYPSEIEPTRTEVRPKPTPSKWSLEMGTQRVEGQFQSPDLVRIGRVPLPYSPSPVRLYKFQGTPDPGLTV